MGGSDNVDGEDDINITKKRRITCRILNLENIW